MDNQNQPKPTNRDLGRVTMMDKQIETDRSDIRDDFKTKVKCWFQNKGILNRLELYLKNQMILEFQRNCGQPAHSQSTNLSPKLQAIKVLVGDFLLQEDLLFSLSVYCTEVPLLLNLTQYNLYVTRLADSNKNLVDVRRLPKPKFNKEELLHVLEALNLNLKTKEFDDFHNVYKSGNRGSLLTSLLGTIPKLIKRHRTLEYLLKKARRREKLFQKLLKVEKNKLKNMYVVVQKAYGVVEKHKSDMNELLRSRNVISNDKALSKNESELTKWQERLEFKERNLEKTYQDQLHEMEDRAKTLEKRELELQSKYQILQREKYELKIDREQFERAKDQQRNIDLDESDKLQEFEQKFYALQAEVRKMLETYSIRQQQDTDDSRPSQMENLRERQTENKIFPSMKEYVNFMEKENIFLKLNSRKQHSHIGDLTNEVVLLKRRLDYLEKKVETSRSTNSELKSQPEGFAIFLSQKHDNSIGKRANESIVSESSTAYPMSRRKLFKEDALGQTYEFSSSNISKDTNLTEDIMADANSKIEALENESDALDRNCRKLHNVLTRNIALSESKLFGALSLGESSPRLSHLSGFYSDADSPHASADKRKYSLSSSWENAVSPNVEQRFGTSSPRTTPSSNSFRELFIKCKKERTRSNDTGDKKAESEYSSASSSPKGRIDQNMVPDKLSNNESSAIVQRRSTLKMGGQEE